MKKILIFALCIFSMTITSACSDDDDNTPTGSNEIPKLNIDNLRESPLKMGAAVNITHLKNDAKYKEILIKEFSSITAENAMKMTVVSKGKGLYFFDDADYIVDFAKQNNMRVHGHTLIWYRETPAWIQSFSGNKEAWKTLMKEYIQDVVTHFKGKVTSWDVVNEVLLDDGTYRPCVWLTNIGTEYIELAFKYAHEADPDAILFYNEYGQEYSHAKNVAINKLADELIAKNVPIHGIGLQMHTDINKLGGRIEYAVRAAAARNLKVHVSELDVSVNPDNIETLTFTDELAKKQQDIYRYVTKAMMDIPVELQFGITMWGVTDQYSWRYSSPDWVLPFSKDYERKPAYDGILQGLYK